MGKFHFTHYYCFPLILDCYKTKSHGLCCVLFAGNRKREAREAHSSDGRKIQCDMGLGAGEEQCTRVLQEPARTQELLLLQDLVEG